MNKRIDLFKVFGFPIRIDLSWLLILFLVTYSLAAGYFPANHPGLPQTAYWAMGFVAAIGLFVSILFHELSHSLVARHYQIKIDGITLFIFGGVAEMKEESPSPKVEFLVAVVGPVASLLLAFIFIQISSRMEAAQMNKPLILIFYYLGFMNGLLALFNLVPAFPLDGGRIFRSLLWAIKKDYYWATRLAAAIGQGFGWLLVGLGIFSFFRGSSLGGLWYVLIGFFLRRASQMSVQQLQVQQALEGISLSEVLDLDFLQLNQWDRLVDVLALFENRTLQTQYPVMDGDQLIGYLPLLRLNELKERGWEFREVREFTDSDLSRVTLTLQDNAWEAFKKMRAEGLSSLFVVEDGKMKGLVTMEKLLARIQHQLLFSKNRGKQARDQKDKKSQ